MKSYLGIFYLEREGYFQLDDASLAPVLSLNKAFP
jgi:hypothetical protein